MVYQWGVVVNHCGVTVQVYFGGVSVFSLSVLSTEVQLCNCMVVYMYALMMYQCYMGVYK